MQFEEKEMLYYRLLYDKMHYFMHLSLQSHESTANNESKEQMWQKLYTLLNNVKTHRDLSSGFIDWFEGKFYELLTKVRDVHLQKAKNINLKMSRDLNCNYETLYKESNKDLY
jgi:hypothetical protein